MDETSDRPLFETSALSKSYRREELGSARKHGIHTGPICIPKGGVIALVGESGTGKTTLFNLLGGLDEPDRVGVAEPPRILLDLGGKPVDIAAEPQRFPRDRVGFVFQSGFLLRNASAGLNLSLPRAQQGRSADRPDLVDRLGSLGIAASEIDERAWKFSGGEAQRIAFVRALAHDPALVFADEPTSNVDYRNAVAIMGQLRDWVREPGHPGRTVLWITHDLRLAAAIADAVLVLHRDNTDAIHPLCLPDGPNTDLETRAATLQRWAYEKSEMEADRPRRFPGLDSGSPVHSVPPSPGFLRRSAVKLNIIRKVGLSEVFSRHSAQRSRSVRAHVNTALSIPDAPPAGGGIGTRAWSWLRSFGQWNSVFALALITVLGAAGISVFQLVDAHFERSVNDPRNCHLIIKTSREQTLDRENFLRYLSARPWSAGSNATDPAAGGSAGADDYAMTPRATCRTGDAAYGRRDARGWGISLARDGECPANSQTTVRLLTADEYEPVWTQIRLLASVADTPQAAPATVAEYLDGQFAEADSIFLAADKVTELIDGEPTDLVGRKVCLTDPKWPETVRLTVKGVVDEVPSWKQNRFAGYLPNYSYDAFRERVGLSSQPTHIALYFSSGDIDRLSEFLRLEGYVFVEDNLDKIRRLIENSTVFKVMVTGFLGLVGLLLIMLTAMSVQNYLEANAQSFALLKAFGMSWRLVFGILLVEIGMGWLIAVVLLGGGLALANLLPDATWVQLNGLALSADNAWLPFLATAGAVWLLSALVSLAATLFWWWRNRYVAQVLKAG